MAKDDSEERPLPPSKKKLDDARRKGQVASSKDMISGAALAGVLGFMILGAGAFLAAGRTLIGAAGDAVADHARHGDILQPLNMLARQAGDQFMATVVPAFGIALALAIMAAIVVLRGIPFSMEPVKPQMEKLNPVEGFKRIFALRSLIEFVKSLLKTVLIVAVLAAVLGGGLGLLVHAPASGLPGVLSAAATLMTPVLAAAIALFIVAGLADVGLQRWLFRRDMKMSLTEQKRERKEQEGDPHIRAARRRMMRENAAAPPVKLGLSRATLLIHGGDGEPAVGLRFVRGETPVPAAVVRGDGPRAAELISQARESGIRTLEDAELARAPG
jgi:type III secretion protein U